MSLSDKVAQFLHLKHKPSKTELHEIDHNISLMERAVGIIHHLRSETNPVYKEVIHRELWGGFHYFGRFKRFIERKTDIPKERVLAYSGQFEVLRQCYREYFNNH